MRAIDEALDAVQNIINGKDNSVPDHYGKRELTVPGTDIPFTVANRLLEAGEEAARKVEVLLQIAELEMAEMKREMEEVSQLIREAAKKRADASLRYTENMKRISDMMTD